MSENTKYAGADWIEKSLKVANMSTLGKEVADLVGDLFRGIYHLPTVSLRKVDWENEACMSLNIDDAMATFDNDVLTRLVVLSHDRMIRVDMKACNFYYTKLLFSKRSTRGEGDTYTRMPTMEEHTGMIRTEYYIKPTK